ncbi:MAG: hypothetical protein KDI63_17170 [Gammaproteobacteria bacterium]|nr:hypothetical protein [Gammaproteobacteria bacterium]
MKKGKDKKKHKDKKQGKGKSALAKRSPKMLEKEIVALRREIRLRDEVIEDLKRRQIQDSAASMATEPAPMGLSESKKQGVALAHRKAWERHQYLRSQYEVHLESGVDKQRARMMADGDLRRRYGDDAGYTEEQLDAILT